MPCSDDIVVSISATRAGRRSKSSFRSSTCSFSDASSRSKSLSPSSRPATSSRRSSSDCFASSRSSASDASVVVTASASPVSTPRPCQSHRTPSTAASARTRASDEMMPDALLRGRELDAASASASRSGGVVSVVRLVSSTAMGSEESVAVPCGGDSDKLAGVGGVTRSSPSFCGSSCLRFMSGSRCGGCDQCTQHIGGLRSRCKKCRGARDLVVHGLYHTSAGGHQRRVL